MPLPAGEAPGMRRLKRFLWGDDVRESPMQESPASSGEKYMPAKDTAAGGGDGKIAQSDCGTAPVQPSASNSTGGEATGTVTAPIQSYKDSRMLAFGLDNSAKLSAHLAAGCLSPKMVHAAVVKAAATQGAEQCGWLVMHLIIRCVPRLILRLEE